MNVGLYFGTFNPIHIGHLIIANYMVEYTQLDQVWLVVSPQNPFKKKVTLLEDYHRLAMVELAIEGNDNLKASNIEFKLPKPSYTIDTLTHLKEKYPKHKFHLIMGEDNLRTFHAWKNYQQILENFPILVYPRAKLEGENTDSTELFKHTGVTVCNAPTMNISASFIRNAIKDKKDVRYLLPPSVQEYVQKMNFYKK